MRICDNGIYRDMTPDEISALESVSNQPAPLPTPEQQGVTLMRAMARTATTLTDAVALSVPDLLPTWEELLEAGETISEGVCLTCNGQTYRVVQSVTPQAHQSPDSAGMLAIYRPIEREHSGTQSDPIPWVYGMDCHTGSYFSYDGKLWLCKGDMIPCVWAPGSAGLWQWEEVK